MHNMRSVSVWRLWPIHDVANVCEHHSRIHGGVLPGHAVITACSTPLPRRRGPLVVYCLKLLGGGWCHIFFNCTFKAGIRLSRLSSSSPSVTSVSATPPPQIFGSRGKISPTGWGTWVAKSSSFAVSRNSLVCLSPGDTPDPSTLPCTFLVMARIVAAVSPEPSGKPSATSPYPVALIRFLTACTISLFSDPGGVDCLVRYSIMDTGFVVEVDCRDDACPTELRWSALSPQVTVADGVLDWVWGTSLGGSSSTNSSSMASHSPLSSDEDLDVPFLFRVGLYSQGTAASCSPGGM